jgi:hypothetical protein
MSPQVYDGRYAGHAPGAGSASSAQLCRNLLATISPSRDPLKFRAERPIARADLANRNSAGARVVEIDHHGKRTTHGPCYPTRDPRQDLLLDPYDIEFAGLDEVVQALGIERLRHDPSKAAACRRVLSGRHHRGRGRGERRYRIRPALGDIAKSAAGCSHQCVHNA